MRNFHFPGRSPTIARSGMAATSHPLASFAAIDCLKRGGNAVDAAITAAALLSVIEPAMTGIGGDCFALLYKPGKGLVGLNGSGRAPAAATLDWYVKAGIKEIAVATPHAVTVPGAIDAWTRLLADYGSRSLADVLAPAIDAADAGFPVAPRVAHDWTRLADKIAADAGARQHLLKEGRPPAVGTVMRFPALASTLRAIARDGRDAFYSGPIADDMIATLRGLGGLHTAEDFSAQRATYVTPIGVPYRGVELFELPPNNQGIVGLILLKLLDRLGPLGDAMSADRYHVLMEASRLAYAVRDRFVSDPDTATASIAHMLSDSLIANLADRIDRKRRLTDLGPIPEPKGSDTTYLTVADKDGMVVSFINSLFAGFGSGIVTPKTGVVLQNRGSGFVLEAGHPNVIAPRKRPLHTLVPAMALKDGKPWLSFGVMGGAFQPMGHVYVLTNMLDHAMDVQEAIDFPRVFFEGGQLLAEDAVPDAVMSNLADRGHVMDRRADPWGGGQSIHFDRVNATMHGGSDGRKDGLALGY